MEEAMTFLKDFPRDLDPFPMEEIFQRALGYNEVNSERLMELEIIYLRTKNKRRVLFVKDHDNERTYLKTLPNLPADEEGDHLTECNVDDASSSGNDGS